MRRRPPVSCCAAVPRWLCAGPGGLNAGIQVLQPLQHCLSMTLMTDRLSVNATHRHPECLGCHKEVHMSPVESIEAKSLMKADCFRDGVLMQFGPPHVRSFGGTNTVRICFR